MVVVRASLHALPFALLAAAGLLALAHDADATAILDTGAVTVGVRDDGGLGVCCGAASLGGTTWVGLRLDSNQAEGVADGCLCEGWSVAYDAAEGHTTGVATVGLAGMTFAATGATATATAMVGDLRVEHAFSPSSATSALVQVDVTLTNTGSDGTGSLRYRRTVDFDAQPTPFQEHLTMTADALPPEFELSCTNGFAASIRDNPDACGGSFSYPAGPPAANFSDHGPRDQGALLQLHTAGLAPGESWSFRLFFGAAPTEAAADAAVAAVDAAWHAYAQSDTPDGPTLGTPATFLVAWKAVSTPAPPPPPCTGAAPGTVPGLAGTVDGTVATLTWGLPPAGDCPLTSFTIEVSYSGATGYFVRVNVGPAATTTSFGVAYCSEPMLRITARSQAGASPASVATATAIPRAPPAPLYLIVSDANAAENAIYTYTPLYSGPKCMPTGFELHRDGALRDTEATSATWIRFNDPVEDCATHTYQALVFNAHGKSALSPAKTHRHGWYVETPAATTQLSCESRQCLSAAGTLACPAAPPTCQPAAARVAPGVEGLTLGVGAGPDGVQAGYVKDGAAGPAATATSCGVLPACLGGNVHAKALGFGLKLDWSSGLVMVRPEGGPTGVKDHTKQHCA